MRKETLLVRKEQVEIWDEKWRRSTIKREIYEASNSPIARIIEEYIPQDGKILDSGCGLGGYIIWLKNKGYNVEGIDFSKDAIFKLKKYDSSLNVQIANCEDLPFPDNYFDIYLSLGVFEHIEHGPYKSLKEANRVLKKGRIVIISIPYINFYRMIKDFFVFKILRRKFFIIKRLEDQKNSISLVKDFKEDSEREFFQYYFSLSEIKELIKKAGFEIVYLYPHSVIVGMMHIPLQSSHPHK